MRKIIYLLLAIFAAASGVFAQQYTISGTVASTQTGEKLVAANVYLRDLSIGEATDENGEYSFSVKKGNYTIVASYVGYETQEMAVNVNGDVTINFELDERQFSLNVTVLADRAKTRETPVAFSTVEKREMETRLGSQDIPMVLNTTPSVYSTMQGGGAGDARVNVRGFDQKNVAIMINGVPINDMENGWVYWSNWDGVGDATSSIQMQRGLSAVNLATPSIGGTMNVITDPTASQFGVKYKQEFGNDGFLKGTLSANSGLINNKFAFNFAAVRKVGDGLIDKTWTDAWAYYFGASYNINSNNRLEIYAMGAPQEHGQNSYKQNIAAYSRKYAKDEAGYADSAANYYPEVGRKFNQTWGSVDPSYKGQQYYWGDAHDRHDDSYLQERVNYYNKPIVNLNWYSQLSNRLSLYTTAYYSGGNGGGSGLGYNTRSSGSFYTNSTYSTTYPRYITNGLPSRIVNWNGVISTNSASTAGSQAILYNSVNEQWTIGAISKAIYKVSESFKTSFGVDWRTATIDHYREVRDLLGGQYFNNIAYNSKTQTYDPLNDFETTPEQRQKKLGDRYSYDNTNKVNWFGFYGQGEYTEGLISLYGMAGWSTVKYDYTDHYRMDPTTGGEFEIESDWVNGYQFKGGASYRFTSDLSVFANAGYVSKVPIFDQVIDDGAGTKVENSSNEKFVSIEGGLLYQMFDGRLTANANYYYTVWADRFLARTITLPSTQQDAGYLVKGMDELHTGIELELGYQPINFFKLNASASFGDWTYTDDVPFEISDYNTNQVIQSDTAYVKDLKVSDMPQTSFTLTGSFYPINGLSFQAVYRYYANYYSAFDPWTRTNELDRAQTWKVPAYGVLDMHLFYDLPINLSGVKFQLFAHVFNVLDTEYIQDATDNSSYVAYGFTPAQRTQHTADDAEVYFGLPRSFNLGISVAY